METQPPIPALFSVPRFTTLIASLFVALSSGTNYVYSAYSPQLGARLQITHTQLNIVGLAGNVGVYSSGPLWGKIVDTRGPRLLLVGAFLFLLAGYSGIRHMYDAGLPEGATTLSLFGFWTLVACSYLTGAGGNGGLTSSVNSTAKTFPDSARATTTGIVLSGFGLSAFFFSTIAHFFYAGNTSSFIFLLAVGTSCPMLVGFFLVRPIPLPPTVVARPVEGAVDPQVVVSFEHDIQTRLLDHDDLEETYERDAVELSPSRGQSPAVRRRLRSISRGPVTHDDDDLPNIYGWNLWRNGDFWLLFSILSMLSGTGLMYINNVGSMSQALFAKNNPSYDEIEAARWQATQVSSISLLNFSGRIFIGIVSDHFKNHWGMPRSYCLVLVSFFFFISQIAAANIDEINNLWIASALLGLAHGSVFSLFPTVCIEWFGLQHFSENWGYLSMSPMVAGNIFSVIFGRNLDAHEEPATSLLVPRAESGGPLCLLGRECYVATLHLTIAATFLSMMMSIWAGWRDRRRLATRNLKLLGNGRRDVLWEAGED